MAFGSGSFATSPFRLRRIVIGLGGELEISARFADGTVKIELFDEAGGGVVGSPWIPGGFGNDQIAARTIPAAGLARLRRTGLVARGLLVHGFTFEMILLS